MKHRRSGRAPELSGGSLRQDLPAFSMRWARPVPGISRSASTDRSVPASCHIRLSIQSHSKAGNHHHDGRDHFRKISGWFTPQGVRYHEDIRSVTEIAPADWPALLAHADEIRFFERPELWPARPSDRIFHLAITAGQRSRELAINDPFETPELAHLIR
jgi:hypothetical protein